MKTTPLIIVTNDDGIDSPGIKSAAEAVLPLGDVLIVAPKNNSSGLGQSMPLNKNFSIEELEVIIGNKKIPSFVMDTSPAQAMLYTMTHLADRKPSLVVSGINYGVNIGYGIAITGTIGAALEASRFGLKGLSISLEVPMDTPDGSSTIDFSVAAHFTHYFSNRLLELQQQSIELMQDVDVLKVDLPSNASKGTPWKVTRSSRQQYWVVKKPPKGESLTLAQIQLKPHVDIGSLELDSDTYAVIINREISVTPLSIDMTARMDPCFFGKTWSGKDNHQF